MPVYHKVVLSMDIVINKEIASPPECALKIPYQANFYHNLLTCLDYPLSGEQAKGPKADEDLYPPIANLLAQLHDLKGNWLIISPIHWEATHNDAMITAFGSALELSDKESHQWFDALSEFLAPLTYRLFYHDAYTWLLQCDGQPTITAKPIHNLLHQSMMPELKNLDETLFWQRFITETQMFFSTHPLNKARLGVHSINGLWVWGAGPLGAPVQKPLICNEPNLLKLSQLLSTKVISGQFPQNPAKNSVLLLEDLNQPDRILLEEQFQSYTVRWYWNNMAYLTKPKRWWSRIIGII